MQEFWLARVFFHENIAGNLTGIIFSDSPVTPESCQALAHRICLPDTAFIWPSVGEVPMHRTFSPHEELRFCTQTLLAAAAVNATIFDSNKSARFEYDTAEGPVTVLTEGDGLWWVNAIPDPAQTLIDLSVLHRLGISDEYIGGTVCIAGIARRRLYIPLHSTEELYKLRLSPSDVISTCVELGINGICLFVVLRSDHIALRVFTTSLAGSEDAATGGAALGLISYDQHYSLGLSETIRVDQGHIESFQRGCLYVQQSRKSGQVRLGGFVDVLSNGSLVNKINSFK